ncbi:hypothetical protein PG2011B_1426 [Bifidobacterium animalis subsp. lactis]|uniref:Uncharacterized protein n=1 Tax=Bifidobacterium animalis subsp. lactis TaxID=302911 RepID=A0A8B3RFD5_BIFAN|nr:hypothetical protein PG2011B_1426 [Bifidobacterium animalis subsp. lactis]
MRGTCRTGRQSTTAGGIIPALAGNITPGGLPGCVPRDHPRACGEHWTLCGILSLTLGSSPRLRGTSDYRPCAALQSGIIPALAGNICARRYANRTCRDHPRACGEHHANKGKTAGQGGSSPRLRGTLDAVRNPLAHAGIIPALAGNMCMPLLMMVSFRDHPRACGEHPYKNPILNHTAGSSPRLRGTSVHERSGEHRRGIIPALAGNIRRPNRGGSCRWDHPRACGEHARRWQQSGLDEGSSPRLRGTSRIMPERRRALGIIPALAGNMRACSSPSPDTGDHPRACGEHLTNPWDPMDASGSSPRLRGTFGGWLDCVVARGIIPALAGNIATAPAASVAARDHPRACGEHAVESNTDAQDVGSSPRLRGTFADDFPIAGRRGIIPALAGNIWMRRQHDPTNRDHPRACGEHVGEAVERVGDEGSSPRLRGT